MKPTAGFDALLADVDRQRLALGRHVWRSWPVLSGGRWRWPTACEQCGLKWEFYRHRQICLGVLGELMLAGEKVPKRWTKNFSERVRVARRAMKPRKKGLSHEKPGRT